MTSLTKTEWRTALLRARRALPANVHDADAAALRAHLVDLVPNGQTICGYVPVGSEPGSIAMMDDLLALGARVLLPVARNDATGTPQSLQWGEYRPGELIDAPFGLHEPAPPWLPAEAISTAAIVLAPALAVDRMGTRLGRGAGFYDRSLRWADPAARRVAVVRDDEFVDRLPADPHDVVMTDALTPRRGLIALG